MSANYYQNEDVPDMNDPDTALSLYEQQHETLITKIVTAAEDVQSAGEKLAAIKAWAEEQQIANLPETTEEVWGHITSLKGVIAAYDSTLSGGAAALKALKEHRDSVVAEYQDLLEAIDKGSESHPKLAGYADEIRADADETAMEWWWELMWDEIAVSMEHIGAPDTLDAATLIEAVREPELLTKKQLAAYMAFLETLVEDDEDDADAA